MPDGDTTRSADALQPRDAVDARPALVRGRGRAPGDGAAARGGRRCAPAWRSRLAGWFQIAFGAAILAAPAAALVLARGRRERGLRRPVDRESHRGAARLDRPRWGRDREVGRPPVRRLRDRDRRRRRGGAVVRPAPVRAVDALRSGRHRRRGRVRPRRHDRGPRVAEHRDPRARFRRRGGRLRRTGPRRHPHARRDDRGRVEPGHTHTESTVTYEELPEEDQGPGRPGDRAVGEPIPDRGRRPARRLVPGHEEPLRHRGALPPVDVVQRRHDLRPVEPQHHALRRRRTRRQVRGRQLHRPRDPGGLRRPR